MKTLEDRVWAQLAKYIANEATEGERHFISTLLRENQEIADLYQKLSACYQSREKTDIHDPAPAFKRLDERIRDQGFKSTGS
jgi:hypothetical protein